MSNKFMINDRKILGQSIHSQLGDQICNQRCSKLWDQLHNQSGDQIRFQLDSQIYDQLDNHIGE